MLTVGAANADANAVVDTGTRTTWDPYGLAIKGPLKGTQLKPLILIPEFWFAWSQFPTWHTPVHRPVTRWNVAPCVLPDLAAGVYGTTWMFMRRGKRR